LGLDVYLRRDIANALRATACASEGAIGHSLKLTNTTGANPETYTRADMLNAYKQGQHNTLVSLGLAFGLVPVLPKTSTDGALGLLWAEMPDG